MAQSTENWPKLAIRMQRHLGDWLIGHISKTDKALGEFMLAKV